MPNIALEPGRNASLGVKRAYGETQEVDGAQFVPVALIISGSGSRDVGAEDAEDAEDGQDADAEASGRGGRGCAIPLGVYVRREEGLRFEPNFVVLLAVGVPFIWVVGRAFSRIIRAFKK